MDSASHPAGTIKIENIEEDDDIQFIKMEDQSDDCIIKKTWTINDAIDVDAESVISVEENDLTCQSNMKLDGFIKKEDNDDFVIGNIWNRHEAIDVDVIESSKRDQESQSMLEVDNRLKETEQDRVDQNHQLERIALARQRLQVQSLVNATTRNPQTESEQGVDGMVQPKSMTNEAYSNEVTSTSLQDNNTGYTQIYFLELMQEC